MSANLNVEQSMTISDRRVRERRRNQDPDIGMRLMHGFLCTCATVSAFTVPGSISAFVRFSAGPFWGEVLVAAMGVIGVLIILDTVVNDIRPPEEKLKWTSRNRHLLHIFGAAGNMIFMFTVAMMLQPTKAAMFGIGWYYLGVALIGVWIAYRDVRRRPGHVLRGI